MSDKSSIEWTDATWNPVRGCSRVSEGCRNCYAERVAARFSGPGQAYEGLAEMNWRGGRWTGEVRLIEGHLCDPLKWRKPRRVFVNSMSDLFHEGLADGDIDRVFAVMALARQHTFQVLTKRAERMRAYVRRLAEGIAPLEAAARAIGYTFKFRGTDGKEYSTLPWPLPNVWLGVSAEDQQTFQERWGHLRSTPSAVRFISMEPLLGPIDMQAELWEDLGPFVWPDWIIVGGESGRDARAMHPEWARSLRDQCASAGVPFFFKQWGEYGPASEGARVLDVVHLDGRRGAGVEGARVPSEEPATVAFMEPFGKKAAGRLLDGRTWDEMPGAAR